MAIPKELWTQEQLDTETKTTYAYVVELRERLQQTCQLAQEELRKAKLAQKKHLDRRARPRQLSAGDKVLLLLPSDNKLILTWKGPFTILERRNDVDYVVDLGTRTSLFHINLLKKYEERERKTDTVQQAAVTIQADDNEDEGPQRAVRSTYRRVVDECSGSAPATTRRGSAPCSLRE